MSAASCHKCSQPVTSGLLDGKRRPWCEGCIKIALGTVHREVSSGTPPCPQCGQPVIAVGAGHLLDADGRTFHMECVVVALAALP
jgi:hypothetical protein